jgi:DNA-binding transcriptional ArsR family regulator
MVAVENEGDENASLYLDRIDEPHARRTLRAATAHRRCAHAAARGFPRAAPASAHLGRLVEAKLLVVEKQGRHRYFRLTSPKVAGVIEALMAVAVDGAPRHRPRSRGDEALALARTCYDHLAGRLGVALADTLIERGHVVLDDDGGQVTAEGTRFLNEFGLETKKTNPPRHARRGAVTPPGVRFGRRWPNPTSPQPAAWPRGFGRDRARHARLRAR